jgi:methyl-accepting chemotaxis protein
MAILPAPTNDEIDHVALLAALKSLKTGDFSVRLPLSWTGLAGKIADAFNDMVEMNERLASELEGLSRVVGTQGKITQRATASGMTGSWEGCIASVNALIDDLVYPTLETARVIGAVAKGDLSQSMVLDSDGPPLEGEFLRTAKIVNSMVDQLGSFASEMTRVVRGGGHGGKAGWAGRGERRGGDVEGPHGQRELHGG